MFPWETLVNLVFSLVIFILGIYSFARLNSRAFVYVGLGFLMFGLSHFIKILEYSFAFKIAEIGWLSGTTISIRILGYLLVVIALFISFRR